MKIFHRPGKNLVTTVSGLVLLLIVAGQVGAAGQTQAPNTLAQSYSAGANVVAGMVVEPKPHAATTVIPLSSSDVHNMLGVVIPVNGAQIVLTPPQAIAQQVLVAPTGRYELLVSNQGGPIKGGDYVTVSALDGVGMKAGSDQPEAIGRAAADFTGKTGVLDTTSLKTSNGRTITVAIGHVPVDIRLAPNPLYHNGNDLPGFLSRAASSIANKPVSPTRAYLSLVVLAATLFITGSMFYGGIRGGITAIGRNPLAKRAVSRGLVQAILFGMIVFILGMLAVYEILI
ncbi:MAG TPA: hypothetical protein VN554_02265 [Verrucomicrobiae bacterium]|nr:hypothetical protein [Verrucomicrobiae bacterium]